MDLDFKFDFKKDLTAPMALAQAYSQDSKLYGRRAAVTTLFIAAAKRALDEHRWDQALDRFSEVATRGGAEADGALYWKAYSLDRLARRDEALATIAELRKAFPTAAGWMTPRRSKWRCAKPRVSRRRPRRRATTKSNYWRSTA